MNSEQEIQNSNYKSIPRQSSRLEKRRTGEKYSTECCGVQIVVNPGVYQTSGDSELMANSVKISKSENFLEIGCGTGVVSISVSKRAKSGIGVDINTLACENSIQNAQMQNISNVSFLESDVFEKVNGKFDVIICNPPYTNHDIRDDVDRMFWDPEDEMKNKFFKDAKSHLKSSGRIYFGWANFADLDINLPFQLAHENGYRLENTFIKPHRDVFNFYVFEFRLKD